MATLERYRREPRRPAWVRLGRAALSIFVPVFVPVLLLVVVFAFSVARDMAPSAVEEPETGLVPGAAAVTGWHRDDSLVPAGFGAGDQGHSSPQALVDAMVAQARQVGDAEPWITGTIVSHDGDAADARVYVPLPEHEDAYIAAELFLELIRAPGGWYVDDAHVRFHCRRAVRDSLCG